MGIGIDTADATTDQNLVTTSGENLAPGSGGIETYSYWVYFDTDNHFDFFYSNPAQRRIRWWYQQGTGISFEYSYSNWNVRTFIESWSPTTDTLNHFVLSVSYGDDVSNTVADLYINGSKITWDTDPASSDDPVVTSGTLEIGHRLGWNAAGWMAEVAFFFSQSDRLTQSEVDQLYNGGQMIYGAPLAIPSLATEVAHYWPMRGQVDGTAVSDTAEDVFDRVGTWHMAAESATTPPDWRADLGIDPRSPWVTYAAAAAPASGPPIGSLATLGVGK